MRLLLCSAVECGRFRLFAKVRSRVLASARASRRAGCGHSADCLPSLREGALRCSASWPVAELTSLAALATFKQTATSQSTKRADARGQEACASRLRTRRCARTPPVALQPSASACEAAHATAGPATRHPGRAQRACEAEPGHKQSSGLFVPGEGPGLCARRGLQGLRSTGLVARARTRALRELTRRVCSSAVSAANVASYAAGPQARAPQGSRSEAKTASPARWALPGCLVATPRSAKRNFNDLNEPQGVARLGKGFIARGLREAQWSNSHVR